MRAPRPAPSNPSALSRRQLIAGAGAAAALGANSLARGARLHGEEDPLDAVLARHAGIWPEMDRRGTNHFPMASEALSALGRSAAITGFARRYGGEFDGQPPARRALSEASWRDALGDYERLGDWLAFFEQRLAAGSWQRVLGRWVPRLAPGLVGAAFHPMIRTAHAARALGARSTPARQRELATSLAYWAARYLPLPETDHMRPAGADFARAFAQLEFPWPDGEPPVNSFSGLGRGLQDVAPFAPRVRSAPGGESPDVLLSSLTRACAGIFRNMNGSGRHGMLFLHIVTGPAAARLLLPFLGPRSGYALVERSWQGAAAITMSYGSADEPPLPPSVPAWTALVERAVASGDAHAIKLVEAAQREDHRAPHPAYRHAAWEWMRTW